MNNSNLGFDKRLNPDPVDELRELADVLEQLSTRGNEDEILSPIEALKNSGEEIERASSGSWLGYQANVYYRNFQQPPPGAHFSKEWGLQPPEFDTGTAGGWVEYAPEDIKAVIHQRAKNPDLEPARAFEVEARNIFQKSRRTIASILEIELEETDSHFLRDRKDETYKLYPATEDEVIQSLVPEGSVSRDRLALAQGHWTPPHISALTEVYKIGHMIDILHKLAQVARSTADHIFRQRHRDRPSRATNTKVFIGHGRSPMWRELKDFMEDQLGLPVDEFNRIPVAGTSITDRLMDMLRSASVAFLVMTGEDEQPTGELRPRENVVHEAGLFQGHLGFQRAIILLEEGCEKFSNNAGLVHIDFPKGNIRAAFHDVREILEREAVLKKGVST